MRYLLIANVSVVCRDETDICPVDEVMLHCCWRWPGVHGMLIGSIEAPSRGWFSIGNKSAELGPAHTVLQHRPWISHCPAKPHIGGLPMHKSMGLTKSHCTSRIKELKGTTSDNGIGVATTSHKSTMEKIVAAYPWKTQTMIRVVHHTTNEIYATRNVHFRRWRKIVFECLSVWTVVVGRKNRPCQIEAAPDRYLERILREKGEWDEERGDMCRILSLRFRKKISSVLAFFLLFLCRICRCFVTKMFNVDLPQI